MKEKERKRKERDEVEESEGKGTRSNKETMREDFSGNRIAKMQGTNATEVTETKNRAREQQEKSKSEATPEMRATESKRVQERGPRAQQHRAREQRKQSKSKRSNNKTQKQRNREQARGKESNKSTATRAPQNKSITLSNTVPAQRAFCSSMATRSPRYPLPSVRHAPSSSSHTPVSCGACIRVPPGLSISAALW